MLQFYVIFLNLNIEENVYAYAGMYTGKRRNEQRNENLSSKKSCLSLHESRGEGQFTVTNHLFSITVTMRRS